MARFLNADIVYDYDAGVQGFNLFAYCGNNLVNRIDISGTDSSDLDDNRDMLDDVLLEGGGASGGGKGPTTGTGSGVNSGNAGSAGNGVANGGGTLPQPPSVGNTNPLVNIQYTDKVIAQAQQGDFHSFPDIVDNYGSLGTQTTSVGGDGRYYTTLRIKGTYLGYDGYFEYMWDDSFICNHRFFSRKV